MTTNLPTIYTLPPAPLPTSLEGEHRASLGLLPSDIDPDFEDITTSTYVEYSLGEHSDSAQLDVLVEAHELSSMWMELGEMPVQLRALDCLEALDQIALKTLDQDPDLSGLALVEARRRYIAQLVLLYLQPEVQKIAPTLDWDTYASRAVGLGEGSAPQTWEEDCRRYQDRVGSRELAQALHQRDDAREKVSQLEEQLIDVKADRARARVQAEERAAQLSEMQEERDAAQNDLAWERAQRSDDQTRIQELEAWQKEFHARGEDTNRAIRDLSGKLEAAEATIEHLRQERDAALNTLTWDKVCRREAEAQRRSLREEVRSLREELNAGELELQLARERDRQIRECITWSTTTLEELLQRLARCAE